VSRPSSRSSSTMSHKPSPPPPAPAHHHAPPPANHHTPPPPVAHAPPSGGGGMLSGLGATMAQGFAFGTGSAIARQAVGSVMDSFSGDKKESAPAPSVPAASAPLHAAPQPMIPNTACSADQLALQNCLKENPNNAASCEFYFNALSSCQASNRF
jgi:hypothetical protein